MTLADHHHADIRRQASEWLAQLRSDAADEITRQEFEAWVQARPEHAHAVAQAETVWRQLHTMPDLGKIDIDATLAAMKRPSLWGLLQKLLPRPLLWPAGLAAGAAAISLAVLLLIQGPVSSIMPDYTTDIAEIRDIALEDGSVITLGAKSSVMTHFTQEARSVTLITGEAFFSVAKNSDRPFYVHTEEAIIHVVGTAFNVKHSVEGVRVSVLEGVVDVIRTGDLQGEVTAMGAKAAPKQTLTAGEMVIATAAEALSPKIAIEPDLPGAWRDGRLVYENASLAEVIADANRYSLRPIAFAADELKALRVTTAFRTDQIDIMLNTIARTQPVVVERARTGPILLQPASP